MTSSLATDVPRGPAGLLELLPSDFRPPLSEGPLRLGRLKVLIVDDDELSRQVVQQLLETEAYEVLAAENGQDALALAAGHQPDVVLLDVMLPDLSGLDVCRSLRLDKTLRQLHILLLTSLSSRDARLAGLNAGADDFLNKPVDLLELRARLRTISRLNRFRQVCNERARFEASVNHSPDGIALFDESGAVLHANPAFDRIVGERRPGFGFLPEALFQSVQRAAAELAVGGMQGPFCGEIGEGRFPRLVEVTVVRLPAEDGKILQVIVRDITERKRLEAQLLQSQRVELLGQLAGGIVHDVNNMLTAISGHATVLSFCPPRDVASHAELIRTSAHQAGDLLRGILSFARGNQEDHSPTDIGAAAREALRIAGQLLGRRIKVHFAAPPQLPLIVGSPNQLHQILLNLCVNARDAMDGVGTLRIGLERVQVAPDTARRIGPDARAGDFVALSVRDTGTGIPAEVLPRLFDPFFTTKPANQGTGLGLATVLRLMRMHGGFVGIETQLKIGTCFTCYLPVWEERSPS